MEIKMKKAKCSIGPNVKKSVMKARKPNFEYSAEILKNGWKDE